MSWLSMQHIHYRSISIVSAPWQTPIYALYEPLSKRANLPPDGMASILNGNNMRHNPHSTPLAKWAESMNPCWARKIHIGGQWRYAQMHLAAAPVILSVR